MGRKSYDLGYNHIEQPFTPREKISVCIGGGGNMFRDIKRRSLENVEKHGRNKTNIKIRPALQLGFEMVKGVQQKP